MNTVLFSQILGPILIAIGIAPFSRPKFFKNMIKDFEKNQGLTYLTGMVTMIIGLVVILNHNIWELSPAVIVTIAGWDAFLKGAIFLIAPNLLFSTWRKFYKNQCAIKAAMSIAIIAGVYLSYFAYFA